MQYIKNHRWVQLVIVLIILLGGLFVWQVVSLQKAHSTFDNYTAFRGCSKIISRTDTDGTCTTNSGQTIRIVKQNGQWYLDGDLPVCGLYIGSVCLFNWP